jgi:hypothetical protein
VSAQTQGTLMVYIGLFFVGIISAAFAALYVPRKKSYWAAIKSPKVKTLIKVNGERNDYGL